MVPPLNFFRHWATFSEFLSPKSPSSICLIFCYKLNFQKAQRVPLLKISKTFRFLSLRYSADFRRSRLVSLYDKQGVCGQAKLVLEENEIVIAHLETLQQKMKDQHHAHIQEVARLTRKCIQLEADKVLYENDFNELHVNKNYSFLTLFTTLHLSCLFSVPIRATQNSHFSSFLVI